jgi:hypothetical protein
LCNAIKGNVLTTSNAQGGDTHFGDILPTYCGMPAGTGQIVIDIQDKFFDTTGGIHQSTRMNNGVIQAALFILMYFIQDKISKQ